MAAFILHLLPILLWFDWSHAVKTTTVLANCTTTWYILVSTSIPVSTVEFLETTTGDYSTTITINSTTTSHQHIYKTTTITNHFTNTITGQLHLPSKTFTKSVCKATHTPKFYPDQTVTTCSDNYSTESITVTNTNVLKSKTIWISTLTNTGTSTAYASTVTKTSTVEGERYRVINVLKTATVTKTHFGHTVVTRLPPVATPSQFRLQIRPGDFVYPSALPDPNPSDAPIACMAVNGTRSTALTFSIVNGSLVTPSINGTCGYYETDIYDFYTPQYLLGTLCRADNVELPVTASHLEFNLCHIDCFNHLRCVEDSFDTWYWLDHEVGEHPEDYGLFLGCITLGGRDPYPWFYGPMLDLTVVAV